MFESAIPVQLESGLVDFPHVGALAEHLQVLLQLRQLRVGPLRVGQDGDRIFQLEDIWVGRVVQQHHVLGPAVEDPQILGVDFLCDFVAVLAVEAVAEDLVVRVDLVQHRVDVGLVTGSENHDFE